MALKNFKTRNGIDVDTYTLPNTVLQATVKTNSATTIDTLALNSFTSAEYLITITQGSKIRTSKVIIHTDGTSVDSTEHSITETGGVISGVNITATTASTNAILQATITDAATTIARIKMSRNLNVVFTPVPADAPTIGTATGGAEQASITFTAPYDNGGATITSYRATSTPGSITGTASSSPVTVSGLTGGTAYTFVVAAINAVGVSAASAASNSVTPTVAPVRAGYFTGGNNSRNIDKFVFSTDARQVITNGSATTRNIPFGFANSGIAGYQGGDTNSNLTSMEKLAFAADTQSNLASSLSSGRGEGSSFANSGTAGYAAGGRNSSNTLFTTVDKFAFSDDSRTTLSSGLFVGLTRSAGMANSGTAGYVGAGSTTMSGSSALSNIIKFTFSNDSVSELTNIFSNGRSQLAACANSGTAGYFAGGYDSNFTRSSSIIKLNFSNDSSSTIAATLSTATQSLRGMANSGVAGYFGGGSDSTGSLSRVDKLTFSNDSRSTLATGLSDTNTGHTSFANSGVL